jgi:hypothetical protein
MLRRPALWSILTLMLASTLVFGVCSRSAHNALVVDGALIPVLRIQPENVSVKKGEIFTVSVILENIPENPGMVGLQFQIAWNQTVLRALNMTEVLFHEVTPPSEWSNIWSIVHEINTTKGPVSYAYTWYSLARAQAGGYSPMWGNHTLVTLSLEAVETGSTSLHFFYMIVGTADAKPLICTPDSGYTPLLPSVVNDGSVRVMTSGVVADINGDGRVDLFDALLLAQHYGSKQGAPNWDTRMDLNGDGEVDIFDVLIFARSFGRSI